MSTTRFPEDPGANPSATPASVEARLVIPTITLVRVVFAVLFALATIWLFTSLSGVIVLIVLSLLIAVVLSELVDWLQKRGLKRAPAALISIVVVCLALALVLAITIPPLVKELNEFFGNLPRIAESLRLKLSGKPQLYQALANKIAEIRDNPSGVLSGAFHFGWGLATGVFVGVLMLTMTVYFLIDGEQTRANVLRVTPAAYRVRVDGTMSGIAGVIKAYFIGRSIISAIFAVFTFALLTVLRVPYAVVFAALSFFLGAIPNIGSLIATVLPALIALAYRGITTALIVAVALIIYQQIDNNYIQPRVLSKTMNVSPVATLIGVLAGGKLLGIIGIILAVPVVGTLPVLAQVWGRNNNATKTGPQSSSPPQLQTDHDVAA
jgi:predicted PurR-regulated permease PerM